MDNYVLCEKGVRNVEMFNVSYIGSYASGKLRVSFGVPYYLIVNPYLDEDAQDELDCDISRTFNLRMNFLMSAYEFSDYTDFGETELKGRLRANSIKPHFRRGEFKGYQLLMGICDENSPLGVTP